MSRTNAMPKLPENHEERIGTPQVIARSVMIDGQQFLVRLQKPFEEPPPDAEGTLKVTVKLKNGKPVVEQSKAPKDESYIRYGTTIIVEAWSDATKSVVTNFIRRAAKQSEQEFSFGARYMMNHATDEEIVDIIKKRNLPITFKYQCGPVETSVVLPKPPVQEKKT